MLRLRSFCLTAAALLAAALLSAGTARAADDAPPPPQRPRGEMNPGMERLRMLTAEKVQKALDLTDAQRDSLKKIADDFRADSRKAREDSKDLSPDERREKMNTAIEALQKKIDDVLDEKQRARAKEVVLQLHGPVMALTQKDVAESLKLTDDQKTKLDDIRKDRVKQIRDLVSGGGRPDAGTVDKIKKITKETNDKATEVLTSDQREQFEKMEGKKIDFDNFDIGLGGRGGFGRGGRGGNGGGAGAP